MRAEARKCLNLKTLFLVLLLLCLNLVFFRQNISYREKVLLEDYPAYTALLAGEINVEDLPTESTAAYVYQNQLEAIDFYPRYIKNFPQRAADIAALQDTGSKAYKNRNLAKTLHDFAGLENLHLSLGPDEAVTTPFDFLLTDLFLIALILYMVSRIFTYEYESGLLPLILAVPGRRRLIQGKIVFVIAGVGLLCLLFYAENIISAGLLFGFDTPDRFVQSIAAFRGVSFPLTVRGYFFLAFIWKWLNLASLALCFLALLTCLKKAIYALPFMAIFWGLEYILYINIPPNSNFHFFHFVNVVHGLDAYTILSRYQNIDLFSFPVSLKLLWPLLCFILLILSVILISYQFWTGAILRPPSHSPFLSKQLDRLSRRQSRRTHGLFFIEAKRALFAGKALGIFLVLIFLSANQLRTAHIFRGSDQLLYDSLIENYQAEVSEETLDVIQEERDRLNQADFPQDMKNIEQLALDRIEAQTQRVLEMASRREVRPYLVNEDAYAYWMNNPKQDFQDIFFSFFCAILAGAGIFARENTVDSKRLLRITPGHRRLRRVKLSLCVLFSVLAFLIRALTRLLIFLKFFQFSSLSVAIPNYTGWENFYFNWPLWIYFILLFIFRLFAAVTLGYIIAVVSTYSKNESIAVTILSALCILPLVAFYKGVQPIIQLTPAGLAEANTLLNSHPLHWLGAAVFTILLIVLSLYLISREWRPQT